VFTRLGRSLAALSRFTRELLLLAACLLIGVLVVPLLVWVVGNRALGPYTHGANTHAGPLALVADFFAGLGRGEITYWLVALGPAVLILLLRVFIAVLWRPAEAPPAALSNTKRNQ
jgi:hypothetical protein